MRSSRTTTEWPRSNSSPSAPWARTQAGSMINGRPERRWRRPRRVDAGGAAAGAASPVAIAPATTAPPMKPRRDSRPLLLDARQPRSPDGAGAALLVVSLMARLPIDVAAVHPRTQRPGPSSGGRIYGRGARRTVDGVPGVPRWRVSALMLGAFAAAGPTRSARVRSQGARRLFTATCRTTCQVVDRRPARPDRTGPPRERQAVAVLLMGEFVHDHEVAGDGVGEERR